MQPVSQPSQDIRACPPIRASPSALPLTNPATNVPRPLIYLLQQLGPLLVVAVDFSRCAQLLRASESPVEHQHHVSRAPPATQELALHGRISPNSGLNRLRFRVQLEQACL